LRETEKRVFIESVRQRERDKELRDRAKRESERERDKELREKCVENS
jgi:hypothetical protein